MSAQLPDRQWCLKYTPDDGDLVERFYLPALKCAVRYDRATGYFAAPALALAMRGTEGLVRNGGKMRLIVGCTLEPKEQDKIKEGYDLRALVEQALASVPLEPPDDRARSGLEMLA